MPNDPLEGLSRPYYVPLYNPNIWFWIADDGRIYKGETQNLTTSTDPDYGQFCTVAMPTPWPRDDAGNQTTKSLQDVLDPYGMTVPK